jgi:hypothetical protein
MDAVRSSEMSNFYQTRRRHIQEDSFLHNNHCENLKSKKLKFEYYTTDLHIITEINLLSSLT